MSLRAFLRKGHDSRRQTALFVKPILCGHIQDRDLRRIAPPQDRLDGRKTPATQVGDRADAQCAFKSAMETPPRDLQGAAKFGNVNWPFARRIHIILCFAYEARSGIERSSPFRLKSAGQAHHEGLDDRPPEEICSLVRGGRRSALNVGHDPRESSQQVNTNGGMGGAHSLCVPECRIGQTVLTNEHRRKLWHTDRKRKIGRTAAMDCIELRSCGIYAHVAGLKILPPVRYAVCAFQ